ncbi:alpha/beta hydrolase [Streptomyces sasae]|uniref:alpha/beta hydrolase n=1 Tax=Streptomyces sasae TaxID=1266772 RepID=UPI00292E1D96|nr:dienelactone hydrolase family protein [Streptomyces sasae]
MERVTFENRGNTVVGNLFKPAGFAQGTRYPAIVLTHPFGSVKEQVPTTYAKLLAERGFITLVFDASYQGESGGEPHFSEFPSARVEDIRRAVDFLSIHPDVDEERIGALGICAGGGYTVNVSQTEMRIKAVAGVSTFDIVPRAATASAPSASSRRNTAPTCSSAQPRPARARRPAGRSRCSPSSLTTPGST